ncbi:MAG: ABC transporter substrate-binding protein [Deltaproteobacteria bacterium]|nr:ABC transporter substrate-binding protein [Deltaproteobacteria bacterium]MBM4323375.1 ABC transporter substrate-binding protein [Deltaproteobacteria bacterium]
MLKLRLALIICLMMLMSLSLFPASAEAQKKLYVGGTQSLTGPFAEDSAAVLSAIEDYVRYVNETKNMAPWRKEKFPADITLEVLWRDDELKPAKALSIYEELKAKGMMVARISGSPIALALKDKMWEDRMGGTSMATGPYYLTPPQSCFTYYPIYTDSLAAIADWFKANWKETRKPKVAYLTADNAMGRSIEIPEMKAYLEKIGYEFVGTQYVPLVPTSPPTTQLTWLKEKGVDLALGIMINPGAQPTVKEMVRLGMGPFQPYKMTFGTGAPGHAAVLAEAMGTLGDGYVCAGSFRPMDDLAVPGIKYCRELQDKYRPGKRVTHIMYQAGILEGMIQVEALRLAMLEVPFEKLTRRDVLEKGFFKIKNLETGKISSTPLTYGEGDIEGVDQIRIDQVQKGKVVEVGLTPLRHIFTRK